MLRIYKKKKKKKTNQTVEIQHVSNFYFPQRQTKHNLFASCRTDYTLNHFFQTSVTVISMQLMKTNGFFVVYIFFFHFNRSSDFAHRLSMGDRPS